MSLFHHEKSLSSQKKSFFNLWEDEVNTQSKNRTHKQKKRFVKTDCQKALLCLNNTKNCIEFVLSCEATSHKSRTDLYSFGEWVGRFFPPSFPSLQQWGQACLRPRRLQLSHFLRTQCFRPGFLFLPLKQGRWRDLNESWGKRELLLLNGGNKRQEQHE